MSREHTHLKLFLKNKKILKISILVLFFLISFLVFFIISKGKTPYISELDYTEYSILGNSGSIIPASCDAASIAAGEVTSHFNGDCTIPCPYGGGSYDPYFNPSASGCPTPIAGVCSSPQTHYSCSVGTSVSNLDNPANWTWTCSGQYTGSSANCSEVKAPCTYPWGGNIASGGTFTAYQTATVNSPASCAPETRTCNNGTNTGSYLNQTCVVKSGAITIPASCTVAAGAATCIVTANWVSANLTSPSFKDQNTGLQLSPLPSGSLLVYVAYGGTTFRLTDSTNHVYDQKTVSATCVAGASWMGSTCEYDVVIAPYTVIPPQISYGATSTITWGTSHATACSASGDWSGAKTLFGSEDSTNITSNSTYSLTCTGLGNPATKTGTVTVMCPAATPVWMGGADCRTKPDTVVSPFVNYIPNSPVTVTDIGTTGSTCSIKNSSGTTLVSGASPINYVLNIKDTYNATCKLIDNNGVPFPSTKFFDYSPVPPPPIVSLKASPATITTGSPVVLTWDITYPGAVQKPAPGRGCTLTANSVCTNGACSASSTSETTLLNTSLFPTNTDINDTKGSRQISIALNYVKNATDTIPFIISNGWKGSGRKTITVNRNTDFVLDCSKDPSGVYHPLDIHGPYEKQTVRVKVSNANEQ